MNTFVQKINEVQITRAMPNCLRCGLPEKVCICSCISELKHQELKINLHVLLHEKELSRNTNTSRLMDFIFDHGVSYYLWERKSPPQDLMKIIESDTESIYLLYPEDASSKVYTPQEVISYNKRNDTNIHVLILDGTWQEARKMLNRSDYLKKLPRLKIDVQITSGFKLRRNQESGNLCTSEAVYHALKQLGDLESGEKLQSLTDLFLNRYEIGRGGHGL